MQYLLLIYENEQRWNQGYMQDELAEYQAFGKEFAVAIRGETRYSQPTPLPPSACATANP